MIEKDSHARTIIQHKNIIAPAVHLTSASEKNSHQRLKKSFKTSILSQLRIRDNMPGISFERLRKSCS